MVYSFEVIQRTNIRYREEAAWLARCELSMMLRALPSDFSDVQVEKLGGAVNYGFGGTRGPTHHPWSYAVNMMLMNPEAVFVDAEGRRCFELSNEPMGGGAPISGPNCKASEIILRQKRGLCYLLMDEAMRERFGSRIRPRDNGRPCPWREEICCWILN